MIISIIVSILSGFTIVTARTINARLAEHSNVFTSTFLNYVTGLTGSFLIFLFLFLFKTAKPAAPSYNLLIYTGGAIGVAVIALSNITVAKLSSFTSTLLLFIGQSFTGILLDIFLLGESSKGIVIGSLIVTLGMLLNVIADKPK